MLHETLCAGPATKLFLVDRIKLSKQDFFLLQAFGAKLPMVKTLGICDFDDYELYAMCVYEDEEKVCFMYPDETPDVGTFDEKTGHGHIRLRIAC